MKLVTESKLILNLIFHARSQAIILLLNMVLTGGDIAAGAGRGAGGSPIQAAFAIQAKIAPSPINALGIRQSRFGTGAFRERPKGA